MAGGWQNAGGYRQPDDHGLFGAIINVDTHKEEIGMQYFPDIMRYLTEFVMKGLTNVSGQNES